MSSSDNPPQDNTPSRSGRRNSERDSDGQRSSSSNIIEFINSQDPNVRSAIQRHTAYHSAAQRREARSRLLRRSSQTRYLEWTRRPRTETDFATSSASSASSVSMSPAPSLPERPGQPTRASSNEQESSMPADVAALESARVSQSPTAHVWASDDDNAVLEFFDSSICQHYQSRELYNSVIAFMLEHDASRHLLLAYAYALRARHPVAGGNAQDQVNASTNFGRGTNVLWNRLQMPGQASSDANVQAVLLLVAYTADFSQESDVHLHADALRTMVNQRGGITAFVSNPTLQRQLLAVERSRRFHLTLDCDDGCPDPIRFPDGLQLLQRRDEG